jgi:hypothetical protein
MAAMGVVMVMIGPRLSIRDDHPILD